MDIVQNAGDNNWKRTVLIGVIFQLLLALVACSGSTNPTSVLEESNSGAPDASTPAITTPADRDGLEIPNTAPSGQAPPPGYEGQTWADIVTEASGQTVYFYMWGGSDLINAWVNGYVAESIREAYGINLEMVPVADAPEYINKVLGEKEAGKDSGGSVDLVWVNGENFRTMRQGDLLYGNWSRFLPSSAYVNWDDPSVANVSVTRWMVMKRPTARLSS